MFAHTKWSDSRLLLGISRYITNTELLRLQTTIAIVDLLNFAS